MYSICTDMEGDMGSTCTVYRFILAVKNFHEFCDSLFIVKIYFAKLLPCHTFLHRFWIIFVKIFHCQNKPVYSTCMCRCPELMQI